jgi:hypothetical protein
VSACAALLLFVRRPAPTDLDAWEGPEADMEVSDADL